MHIRNKMLKVFFIAICLSMLCSCTNTAERQQTFYDEVNVINERHARETSRVPDVSINDYTPKIKPKEAREVGFTEEPRNVF